MTKLDTSVFLSYKSNLANHFLILHDVLQSFLDDFALKLESRWNQNSDPHIPFHSFAVLSIMIRKSWILKVFEEVKPSFCPFFFLVSTIEEIGIFDWYYTIWRFSFCFQGFIFWCYSRLNIKNGNGLLCHCLDSNGDFPS